MSFDDLVAYYRGLGIREERARFMALTHYWYQAKAAAQVFKRETLALMERRFMADRGLLA